MRTVILLLVVSLIVVFSCTPKEAPVTPPPTVPPGNGGVPSAQREWDNLVAAAQQEGSVMMYTYSGPEVLQELKKAFGEKYQINLEWVVGRGAETEERVMRERSAGLFLPDVYLSGTSGTLATLKPAGVFEPLPPVLILPEVKDPKNWYDSKLQYSDSEGQFVLIQVGSPTPGVIVNSQLVKPTDIQSFNDLLAPQWKGKISLDDPTMPGAGQRWFRSVAELMGVDFMRQLVSQEPVVMRNDRLRFEWVVRGTKPLTLGHKTDTYAEFVKIGAPVTAYYLKEGAWMTGRGSGLSLINRAPHPNAAKVFINWVLTKEGQTIYSRLTRTQSLRLDVPSDFLTPEEIRKPGAKYIMVENEAYMKKDGEFGLLAKDIFKSLMQ